MAHQSLYRRYRSQKFSEVVGQSHITTGLRNAVAEGREGHAYLFSGPRGTGKTSTARILAKALNCPDVTDGEPCAVCDSCLAIETGSSFDLHELDAASNNKVDDVRDLIARVNLGSPGRTKVYILDEVHMLSSGAENALLKTLEEPPDHVVFVLATTEPHKVVPTIRSRTQRFDFHLLPADELGDHIRWIIEDAGLDVDEDAIDYVLAQGGGSARDTLSALDMVAAAGGVPAGSDVGLSLTRALGANDPAAAIAAIQEGLTTGQEPRTIGEATVDVLRNTFLAAMGAPVHHLNDRAQDTTRELADQLGPATVTRALEALGQALVDMRQAPDPRVPLEVAVLRLCRGPDAGAPTGPTGSTGSTGQPAGSGPEVASDPQLVVRVAELERLVADLTARLEAGGGATGPARADGSEGSANPPPSPRARSGRDGGGSPGQATGAGAATGSVDGTATGDTAPADAPKPSGPAAAARNRLAEVTGQAPSSPRQRNHRTEPPDQTDQPAPGAGPPPPASPPGDAGDRPTLSAALTYPAVNAAFGDCLDRVSQKTRVRFKGGRILSVEGSTVVFGVPNPIHRDRCHDLKGEIEEALGGHFGQTVTVNVIVDGDAPTPTMDPARLPETPRPEPSDDEEDIGPVEELVDATDQSANGIDRLTKAFPGSKVVDPPPDTDPGQ